LLVEKAKKKKKWKIIADAPRPKLLQLKKIYVDDEIIRKTLELYELFRDVDKLEKVRQSEFRKGVNLKISYKGDVIDINLEKLKEYSDLLERFISSLK
jgi:hypothetical protein